MEGLKPRLLTVKQTTELLNISRGKLYRLLNSDPLFPRPLKIGGKIFFIPDELDEWLSLQKRVER